VRVNDALRGIAGLFAGSQFLARFQSEVRRDLRVRHVFLISSGRAAFTVVLRALRALSPRREVVVPAYTCFSVPAAVERAGLEVVPCDVDPARFDFDRRALDRAMTPRTLCVVPSHLFGIPSDLARIVTLARERGAFVVEDAAQALGVRVGERALGTVGDVGFFSFDRGKSVTCGSGGMIVTDSDRIADAVRSVWDEIAAPGLAANAADVLKVLLMAVFVRPWLYWIPARMPWLGLGRTVFDPSFSIARMSGAKAAILAIWRRRLEEGAIARSEAAAHYRQYWDLVGFGPAAGPHIRLPVLAGSREERDRILRDGRRQGLGIGTMYPTGIDEIEALKGRFEGQTFPGARMVAERLVTLPTHRFATARVRQAICWTIDAASGWDERECLAATPVRESHAATVPRGGRS
jgi:perosamine synthetase